MNYTVILSDGTAKTGTTTTWADAASECLRVSEGLAVYAYFIGMPGEVHQYTAGDLADIIDTESRRRAGAR